MSPSAVARPASAVLTESFNADHRVVLGQASPTSDIPQAEADFLETLLELVNAERAAVGIEPLTLSPQLTEAAQRHADDMASNAFLNHAGSDGSTMQTRIEATGYNWSAIGENVAMGQRSPAEVMNSWMSSPGHRQNILNPNFSELGLGYAEAAGSPYWVQVFATAR